MLRSRAAGRHTSDAMILAHQQIIAAVKSGDILIEPFDERQVQAATYDLRVGEQGATTSTKKIVNLRQSAYLSLAPGDFAVVTVLERIELGAQYVARFGLRSKYARKGLIATTGPQIDPGYRGRLIVGVTNLTPRAISLPYGDDFLSVEFHKLTEASAVPYSGPYQDRVELGPEEIEAITESEGMALSEVLITLRTLTRDVGALSASLKRLEWLIPLIIGVGLAVVGTIVAVK